MKLLVAETVTSNDRMIGKQSIETDVEGSGLVLISHTVLAYTWRA
jgi:hypothetical protein